MAIIGSWSLDANGNGAGVVLDHRYYLQLTAWGTWDGAAVAAEFSPDGGTTWIDISGVSLTSDGVAAPLSAPHGYMFRPVVSSAGASTDLTVELREVM